MIILFNDNIKNYDAKGDYNGETFTLNYKKKTSAVAYAEVDIATGDIGRKLALGPEVVVQLSMPKYFEYDSRNKVVWMIFVPAKKKYQFGKFTL